MTTATHNYGWLLPDPGGSANTWGNILNGTTQAIDAKMWTINASVGPNEININRTADGGLGAVINFQNIPGTQLRWQLGETSETESGGNVGTNFILRAYDDTGAFLGNAFEVLRSNQTVGFSQAVTVGGALNVSGSATFAGSLTAANNISCNTLSVTTSISVPSTTSPTVNATTVNATTVNATTVNATGLITGNNLTASNGFVNIVRGTATNSTLFLNDNAKNDSAFFYDQGTLQTIVEDLTSGAELTLDSVGNFHFNGTANAYKAGGGSWVTPSDERIKTVTGEYTASLDEVLQLRPVSYVYKGNDAPPGEPSPTMRVEGRQFIGFVAQELEQIMPEMVSRREGYVDGKKVTDLRDVDVSSLVFALVNCVRELKAEIEELKAAR